ncbi:MAG: transporter substrate-binding domain-containing protein [Candidatus Pacebacteria bacterium]|nr:transporter substrate-binding domain-containing protein [Candidatus Paceibacterota bacterium]
MFGKKSFLIALSAVVLAVLIAGCVSSPAVIEEKPVAIVSGHPDWKPVMWRNGDNISGIGPEVCQMVFGDIGVQVDSRYVGPWDVVQEKARTGEIDAIVALYKTRDREKYLYYSIPYTTDPIVLFFEKGKQFAYSQKEDLIGKKGVATVGDSYGQEMDDFILKANLNVVRVDTPQLAFSLLQEGKADYFIYSMYAGRTVINELNLSGFKESGIVSNQSFYIGVSKKSPYAKYMRNINASLERLIAENKIPTE